MLTESLGFVTRLSRREILLRYLRSVHEPFSFDSDVFTRKEKKIIQAHNLFVSPYCCFSDGVRIACVIQMKFDLPVANKQSPSFIATRLTLGTTPELLISHANSKNISFSSHFLIYFLNFESYWDFQANTLRYTSVLKNHFKLSSSLYQCLNLNSVTLQTKSTSDQVKPTNIGLFEH